MGNVHTFTESSCDEGDTNYLVTDLNSIPRISWVTGFRMWDGAIVENTSYYSSLWISPLILAVFSIIFLLIFEFIPCRKCGFSSIREERETPDIDVEYKHDDSNASTV